MTTIEDVAKLAGLSRTTVSRVINDHPYVTEEKKRLVKKAMDELGYVPNSSARRLRFQKTDTIAVLIPRVTNPFFSKLVEAMEIYSADNGFQLIMCQTRYSPTKELKYLDLLKTRQVDGIILASIQNDWEVIEPYLKYGPIVLCNEFDDKANVPSVRLNQEYGGYVATKHLIEQGHERIAYCAGGYVSNVANNREIGFRRAMNEFQKEVFESDCYRDAFNIEDGRRVFHKIKESALKPTAVFTGSDEVAAGIVSEAKNYGWEIPDDLAVVGFDNQTITELMQPSITTVNQPIKNMAQKAMYILINQIHTKKRLQQEIHEFELELIVRGSTVKIGQVASI